MKRFFLGIALLCSLCVNAQTITTQSSCDSNGDGTVDVQDRQPARNVPGTNEEIKL